MKSRRVVIAYIVVFIVCMCLPHALFLVCKNHVDTSNYEKRGMTELPIIGEVGYENYADEFEAFYNDHIPFRNQLIELRNRLAYYLFNTSMSDQVLVGRERWLFLTDDLEGDTIADYTGEHVLSEEELELIVGNLLKCKEVLDDRNIEFVVMISPNKARVYPEFLPKGMSEAATVYPVQQLVDYLRENTDIKIIYDYEELLEEKERLGENAILYRKSDTHWNGMGAYIGASVLLNELGVHMPNLDDESISIEQIDNEEADLARMLHMMNDLIHKECDYKISNYSNNTVTTIQNDFRNVIEYSSDSADDRRVYIVRDSFATAMGEYIGSAFSSTYMRHYETYCYEDLYNYNPDVFVLECVERTAPHRFANFSIFAK